MKAKYSDVSPTSLLHDKTSHAPVPSKYRSRYHAPLHEETTTGANIEWYYCRDEALDQQTQYTAVRITLAAHRPLSRASVNRTVNRSGKESRIHTPPHHHTPPRPPLHLPHPHSNPHLHRHPRNTPHRLRPVVHRPLPPLRPSCSG